VSFAAITLCVASQRVFIVYFVIDSIRKLLNTPSYVPNVIVGCLVFLLHIREALGANIGTETGFAEVFPSRQFVGWHLNIDHDFFFFPQPFEFITRKSFYHTTLYRAVKKLH
jgi:hypothetical protein